MMRATNMFRNFKEVRKTQTGAYSLDEKYILVANENPLEAKVLSGYLENLGYTVKDVYSGNDAWKCIQTAAPILIISSINIPGLKCHQLCQMLKNNPSTASIPFIMMSSSDAHPDKALGFQQGCDDYITKPLDPGVLKSRVESLLRRSKQYNQIKLASSIQSITSVKKSEPSEALEEEVSEEQARKPFTVETVLDDSDLSAAAAAEEPGGAAEEPVAITETALPELEEQEKLEAASQPPVISAQAKTTQLQSGEKAGVKKSVEEFRAEMEKSLLHPRPVSLKVETKPESKELPYKELSGYMEKLRSAADSFRSAHAAELKRPAEAPQTAPIMPEKPPLKPSKPVPPQPEFVAKEEDKRPQAASPKSAAPAPEESEEIPSPVEAVEEQPAPPPAEEETAPPHFEESAEEEKVIEPSFKKLAPETKIKAEKSLKISLPTRKQITQANSTELYKYGHDIITALSSVEGRFGSDEFLSITAYCDKMAEAATANNELLSLALSKETDPNLATHAVNCAIIALRIGKNLQVQAGELSLLCAAGLLFDIGMITIDEKIRAKRGELSGSEYSKVKQHVENSVNIITEAIEKDFPQECKYLTTAIAQHHERQEGQGYPHKLTGDKISRAGKILGIADTYEAMCHTRFHRSRQTTYRALQEVVGMKKTFFDPIILRALVNELTFFPIGCYVRLNTEEIGVVIDVSPIHSMRPKVKIITDSDSTPLDMPKIVDLVQSPFLYVVKPLEDEDIPELM